MKYKTLNNFQKEVIGIEDKMISETKLKLEAIKMIISLRMCDYDIYRKFPNSMNNHDRLTIEITLKHFLDITEEDINKAIPKIQEDRDEYLEKVTKIMNKEVNFSDKEKEELFWREEDANSI